MPALCLLLIPDDCSEPMAPPQRPGAETPVSLLQGSWSKKKQRRCVGSAGRGGGDRNSEAVAAKGPGRAEGSQDEAVTSQSSE